MANVRPSTVRVGAKSSSSAWTNAGPRNNHDKANSKNRMVFAYQSPAPRSSVYDSPSVDTLDLVPLVVLFGYAVPAFVVFLASGARASGAQAARLATVPRSPYL